jgi:hypothetical protein
MSYFKGCKINHFGYGISMNIDKKILELIDFVVLIISLDYLIKME